MEGPEALCSGGGAGVLQGEGLVGQSLGVESCGGCSGWTARGRSRCPRAARWLWLEGRNDAHVTAPADGTESEVRAGEALHHVDAGLGRLRLGRLWCVEERTRLGEALLADAIGEQTIVADAHEVSRDNVEEEAADELRRLKRELTPAVLATAIAVAEGDGAVLQGDEALVSDGNAVGVASEIAQGLFWSGDRRFAVDDPGLGRGLTEEHASSFLREVKIPGDERLLKRGKQLSAEELGEGAHGQEEVGPARDPALTVEAEAATGDDEVEVGMEEQHLRPGVQQGDDRRRGSQAPARELE
jgi:hypothetical protein